MSISGKKMLRHLLGQLAAAVFLAIFGAVYEQFSHGVYSPFMMYAFAIPLVLGAAPYAVLLWRGKCPERPFLNLWNGGIAVLSVGSVFRGVLEIYGTTNDLAVVYPVMGGILLGLGALYALLGLLSGKTAREDSGQTDKRISGTI